MELLNRRTFVRTAAIATAAAALASIPFPAYASTAPPMNDDYPYKNAPRDGGPDPWGFPYRECTSFVAWRMHRDGYQLGGVGGNAGVWDQSARAHGFAVDNTPSVGAIAQWHGNEKGAFGAGHVAYVAQVDPNGTVWVEDYNWNPYAYKLHSFASGSGVPPRYIHIEATKPPSKVLTSSAVPFRANAKAGLALHDNPTAAIYEYTSTGSSFSFQGPWVQPVGAIDWMGSGDFNGDGKSDVVIHASNGFYVYLSTGTSFAFQGVWVQPVGTFDWAGVGDFNGDGKADIAIHASNGIYVYLSTGTSFAFQGVWVQPVGAFDWAGVGDFNGDGKSDFAIHASNGIYTYLSTGNSFAFQGVWVQPVGAFDQAVVGDFNGDGKTDFAIHASNGVYTYLSTGNSFAFQGVWVQPVGAIDWMTAADFNGDRKSDIAIHASNGVYTYLSTGNSFAFQGVWVQPVGVFDWLVPGNYLG